MLQCVKHNQHKSQLRHLKSLKPDEADTKNSESNTEVFVKD